jgi:nitrogenase molybdenum-iron protein alpha/beta subunit
MYLEPSGFIGAAMAVQGIRDATVVLHGQNGCRKGLLSSQMQMLRTTERDRRFYGAQNAIPFSNIRPEDYYRSTLDRLEEVMEHVDSEEYALKVLMCSPGISLIGDDCKRVTMNAEGDMLLDTDSLPKSGPKGFDQCLCDILEFLSLQRTGRIEKGVNIIGLSIMHKDWQSYCHELTHLLKDAGFKPVCVLGAGCSVEEIRQSVNASFNIVVDPGYSEGLSQLYANRYGIPSIGIGRCRIGFEATEELFVKIGDVTGTRLDHGMMMVKKSKKRAFEGVTISSKTMTGRTFGIIASESTAGPLREWLESSFGMVESYDRPDYLFAPGNVALLEQAAGRCGKGVDIGFPSSIGAEFLKKPLMGLEGSMYLLDSLFN